MASAIIKAGAATEEITPKNSQFLYGYPYVMRMSEGAHDPLTCTALYINNGARQVMFITHDIHSGIIPKSSPQAIIWVERVSAGNFFMASRYQN